MADEKSRDMNQQQDQGNEKAKGAAALGRRSGSTGQGQQGRIAHRTLNRPDRVAAVQGTGQRQPSQGQSGQGGQEPAG